MGEFDNKVVIITGSAGAGIGQSIARNFAQEGANVVISDAHEKRPFALAEELNNELGEKTFGIQCDVRNSRQVKQMVESAVKKWGTIDVLVNNAGIDRPMPVWEMDDNTWDLVMDVNLRGTFYCCREVLPIMIEKRYGKIINLSSIAAWMGSKDEGSAYMAAKAGILGFTRSVAAQVGGYNINVNAIAPGLVFNDFLLKVRPPDYFDEFRKQIVVGRDGMPQDISNAVLFLASDKANYITGSSLCVSGGSYMH